MKTAMMTMGLAVVLGLAISAVGTVTPVDISRQANMGFRDEVEGDRKGGWTDQGPVNDLAMMPTGTHQFGNVTFKVIDPGTNGGKSCLVLSGPEREYFPRRIDIPMQGQRHRFVYMLHACAWTPKRPAPIGSLDVTYETSERQTIEVSALRDVGDWWKPFSVANGAVVWTSGLRP